MTENELKQQERQHDSERSQDFLDMLHNFKSSYVLTEEYMEEQSNANNQTATMKNGHAVLTRGTVGRNTLSKMTQSHIMSI